MEDMGPKLDPTRSKIVELSFRKSAGGISQAEEDELKKLQDKSAMERRMNMMPKDQA